VWKLKNDRIFVTFQGATKEVLSDSLVRKMAATVYEKDKTLVGRTSEIYHMLNKRYWNVSLPKVRAGLGTSRTYTLQDAR